MVKSSVRYLVRKFVGRLSLAQGLKQRVLPSLDAQRERLARVYLKGNEIEIGALNRPLKVPSMARVAYVDRMTVADLRKQYPELAAEKFVEADIIDDGEKLAKIEGLTN